MHPNLKLDLKWVFAATLGPRADLDPVQVMARGVGAARLPGSKVPFRTVAVPLRSGDPGFSPTKQYRIPLTRSLIEANGDHTTIGVQGQSRVSSFRNRPLGYEVEVLQDGRLLARFRLAGTCNATICNMRTVKVQV